MVEVILSFSEFWFMLSFDLGPQVDKLIVSHHVLREGVLILICFIRVSLLMDFPFVVILEFVHNLILVSHVT